MKKRNEALLLLAALIWGIAFVAQSEGGSLVGPYTFNCVRSFVGCGALLIAIRFLDRLGFCQSPKSQEEKKTLVIGGILCGCVLFIASNLQQVGINMGTPSGKAGFLTACYILLVPILGMFVGKKCGLNIWIGVAMAVAGLYLLCMEGRFTLQLSDILLMLCALAFSFHILVIDHFSPLVDGVRMSCIQFLTVGVLTSVPMIFLEMKPLSGGFADWSAALLQAGPWVSILYAGVCSSGIAYTLQIVGQEGVNPTIASLLMSFESVFSVVAGWVLLHEVMSLRGLAGCALIFAAVVLAQLPERKQ